MKEGSSASVVFISFLVFENWQLAGTLTFSEIKQYLPDKTNKMRTESETQVTNVKLTMVLFKMAL